MKMRRAVFGISLAVLFGVGLALGGFARAQSVAEPLPESGRWSFISKVDFKCVDNGDMDFCDDDKDNVCKLGIKKDSDGNVLEKKCQN